MSIAYLDSSALVKFVVAEAETAALQAWIQRPDAPVTLATSTLTRVELSRAARRHSAAAATIAGHVLSSIDLIMMTPEVLGDAASIDPAGLRTLDAIHLATARQIGSSLSAFVAYDARLLDAAVAVGLPVISPR